MQSLEAAACEQAEHLLQQTKSKSKLNSSSQLFNDKTDIQFISINQKLRDLYEEECAKDFSKPFKPTRSPSRLLSKLVVREGLSTLLVRLYQGDRGFSVALGGCGGGSRKGGTTAAGPAAGVVLPYDQNELLHYIDQEELPPGLGDLLEKAPSPIFYGGCVIAEIHDMRHCPAGHTRFVLLRPSNQSLLCDINTITRDGDWSQEERMALESQLLQATQGPLCLDPSPSVSMAAIRARQQGLQLNSAPLRRVARKFSQVSVHKKRKLDQYASQCSTPLLDFIQQRKPKTRTVPTAASAKLQTKPSENGLGAVEQASSSSTCIPAVSDVLRLARALEPMRQTSDCTPQLAEEYTLETERAQGRVYHIRLSVLQRPSSSEFLGELYVDRDYKEGVKNGASCRFALGTRAHAIRYIQQFTEIFTEEGRKSVRITRIVPGEPNRVTYTGSLREREIARGPAMAAAHQAHLANQAAAQAAAAQAAPVQPVAVTASVEVPAPLQQNLLPVLQAQAPQQPVAITNSALLAQQLQQQSPIASTPGPMQMSPGAGSLPTSPVKPSAVVSPTCHTSNAAISALVTSLMNSAQQFQQKNAMTNSAAVAAATNSPLLQQQQTHQQKPNVRKIASNNLLSSCLAAPIQTVPIAPLPSPSSVSCVSLLSPQSVQMSALTSQLNSPPVISPAQCFSLATSNFTYTIPNKVVTTNHAARLPTIISNVQSDITNGNRRQTNIVTEQLASNFGPTMPALSALLANTPSADNPIPGLNSNSTLLERLTAPQYVTTSPVSIPASTPSPKQSPMSSPSHPPAPTLSFTNLNKGLASLQGAIATCPGMENVQLSIPGLSLSLNVSTPQQQGGVIVTSLPLTNTITCQSGVNSIVSTAQSPTALGGTNTANHTMLLTNSVTPNTGQMLSFPVAQVVTPAMKAALSQPQAIRAAPSNSVVLPQLAPGSHQQSIQLVGTLRGTSAGQVLTQATQARGLIPRQTTLKMPIPQTGLPATSTNNPVVAINAQQQLQFTVQQKQLQQCLSQQQKSGLSGGNINSKHRRRSSTAEPK